MWVVRICGERLQGEAEICEDGDGVLAEDAVALRAQEYVLTLEVSVHDLAAPVGVGCLHATWRSSMSSSAWEGARADGLPC